MSVAVREISSKTGFGRTGIRGYTYCLNPYVGCQHGCRYCYARFMKRFTGHSEPWGAFVDVKTNIPSALARQLKVPRKGNLLIGTVTDPYQPLETQYAITRKCLEILSTSDFSVNVLTRSPLIMRDIDVILRFRKIEIGISIGTDDENIRKHFEPYSPPIKARVEALEKMHEAGVETYAFIGPMLPLNPDKVVDMLSGIADSVLIDKLNYAHNVVSLYRELGIEDCLTGTYFQQTGSQLKQGFEIRGVPTRVLFDE